MAFESSSGQQAQILNWLLTELTRAAGEQISVASVGAGSGILDVPMLAELARVTQVDYLVVEPFAEQCAAFEARATEALDPGNPKLEIAHATLDSLETERHFDRVLAIHSIYYFPDLSAALQRLVQLTNPGGEVVIAVAPREEMNLLAEVFWRRQQTGPIWFEEDVLREIKALGITPTRERIDAELLFDPEAPTALDIASFLVQCPLASLVTEERELTTRYLLQVGERRGDRIAVPHPVSILKFRV